VVEETIQPTTLGLRIVVGTAEAATLRRIYQQAADAMQRCRSIRHESMPVTTE